MRKSLPLLVLLLALFGFSRAEEPIDLGQGLSYLRVHSVGDALKSLQDALAAPGALVIDLRYATAGGSAPEALKAALAARPRGAALFILVSPSTPRALEPVIASSGALTLGVSDSDPAPKVVVHTEASADRKAYDAADTGTALDKLISGKIEKERFDEATLVSEFKNGNPDPDPFPSDRSEPAPTGQQAETSPRSSDSSKAGGDDAKDAKPTVPTDRVLQRAVHLHRALLALRR